MSNIGYEIFDITYLMLLSDKMALWKLRVGHFFGEKKIWEYCEYGNLSFPQKFPPTFQLRGGKISVGICHSQRNFLKDG
jgi:predicted amidohydrolase